MERTCLYCARLKGCHLLKSNRGFEFSHLRMPGGAPCSNWSVASPDQISIRKQLYVVTGPNALAVLHGLSLSGEDTENSLASDTSEQLMSCIVPGMAWDDRYHQLLNEEVTFVGEDGVEVTEARPRPAYVLRQLASDPDGHVKLSFDQAAFFTIEQIIAAILKAEASLGLIGKKPTKKQTEQQEQEMAGEGKRVVVGRKGPAAAAAAASATNVSSIPAKAGGTKVATPPKRTGVKTAVKNTDVVPAEPFQPANAQPSFNVDAMVEKVTASVVKQILGRLGELEARIVTLEQKTIDSITILHDMLVQTGGTMSFPQEDEEGGVVVDDDGNVVFAALEEKFGTENKILSYLDDAGE